jgi:hypothetical protein
MSKAPTAEQKRRWNKIAQIPCLACGAWPVTLHHCGIGGGGRKNHDRVVPLCAACHLGPWGIDGRQKISKKQWQEKHMTEAEMEARVRVLLLEDGVSELIG